MGEHLNPKDLAKYFIHGIAFSLLFVFLAIAWVFILVILVGLGFIIGLIIGLGLLFLIVGFLNSLITTYLWFEVKTSFLDLLFHGLGLFIILLIVNGIFVTVPSLVFPGIATSVITFIIACFPDGFVGKTVAGWWKQEHTESIPEVERSYPLTVCSSCKKEIAIDYRHCPWCGSDVVPTTLFCPSCKKKILRNYNPCPWCGTQLTYEYHAK